MNLDVKNNTALEDLSCGGNQLTAAALNALFGTLHDKISPRMYISTGNNPGSNTCNLNIATNKGWKVDNTN